MLHLARRIFRTFNGNSFTNDLDMKVFCNRIEWYNGLNPLLKNYQGSTVDVVFRSEYRDYMLVSCWGAKMNGTVHTFYIRNLRNTKSIQNTFKMVFLCMIYPNTSDKNCMMYLLTLYLKDMCIYNIYQKFSSSVLEIQLLKYE